MATLGFDGPAWVALLAEHGCELEAQALDAAPGLSAITLSYHDRRLTAACVSLHGDKYEAAWKVTQALTDVCSGVVGQSVGLRVTVGALQVDVPADYFAEATFTRHRWATHARSMLVNVQPQ